MYDVHVHVTGTLIFCTLNSFKLLLLEMNKGVCRSCGSGAFDSKWEWACYYCNRATLRDCSYSGRYRFHKNCMDKWERTLPKHFCWLCSRYYYTSNIYIKNPELLNNIVLEEWDLMDLLKYAVTEDNLSLIEKLYSVAENIFINDDFALRMSVELGRLDLVKFLIEHGANVHAENDAVLLLSFDKGHFEIAKYLIEQAGADPHLKSEFALMYSAVKGRLEIVKYLVEHGANIHAENDEALKIAIRCGHLAIVKFLIENGANIHDITDLINISTRNSNRQEVIEYLMGVKMM